MCLNCRICSPHATLSPHSIALICILCAPHLQTQSVTRIQFNSQYFFTKHNHCSYVEFPRKVVGS